MKILYFIALMFIAFNLKANDSTSIEKIVVLPTSKGCFIEIYTSRFLIIDRNFPNTSGPYRSYAKLNGSNQEIFITTTGLEILKKALVTSIQWADLNEKHRKVFEKEVCCRFWGMDKDKYQFHGWVQPFANEYQVVFYGKSDGSFSLYVHGHYFSTKKMVQNYLDLLNGKSVNKEIDDIFKD